MPVVATNVEELVFESLIVDEEMLVVVPVGLGLLELVEQTQGQEHRPPFVVAAAGVVDVVDLLK